MTQSLSVAINLPPALAQALAEQADREGKELGEILVDALELGLLAMPSGDENLSVRLPVSLFVSTREAAAMVDVCRETGRSIDQMVSDCVVEQLQTWTRERSTRQ